VAIDNGNVEDARVLVARGANVNLADAKGRTPLILAASKNMLSTAQLLVDHNADLELTDKKRHAALWYAVRARCVFHCPLPSSWWLAECRYGAHNPMVAPFSTTFQSGAGCQSHNVS
jgi:hypothetical protein